MNRVVFHDANLKSPLAAEGSRSVRLQVEDGERGTPTDRLPAASTDRLPASLAAAEDRGAGCSAAGGRAGHPLCFVCERGGMHGGVTGKP